MINIMAHSLSLSSVCCDAGTANKFAVPSAAVHKEARGDVTDRRRWESVVECGFLRNAMFTVDSTSFGSLTRDLAAGSMVSDVQFAAGILALDHVYKAATPGLSFAP